MPVFDTNYVEPMVFNMVERVEDKVAEDFVLVNSKEATEGIANNVETTNNIVA